MDIYEKRREMPDVTEGGDSGDVDGSPEYMSQPSRNWFDTGAGLPKTGEEVRASPF